MSRTGINSYEGVQKAPNLPNRDEQQSEGVQNRIYSYPINQGNRNVTGQATRISNFYFNFNYSASLASQGVRGQMEGQTYGEQVEVEEGESNNPSSPIEISNQSYVEEYFQTYMGETDQTNASVASTIPPGNFDEVSPMKESEQPELDERPLSTKTDENGQIPPESALSPQEDSYSNYLSSASPAPEKTTDVEEHSQTDMEETNQTNASVASQPLTTTGASTASNERGFSIPSINDIMSRANEAMRSLGLPELPS